MIAWLRGQLLAKNPPTVLLNVNGVGYEMEAPLSVFYQLPDVGETVSLFTHLVVREDAQLLFAFESELQRDIFRTLIRVNGVGPKVALAILSTLTIDELMLAMSQEDVKLLTKVPGIGAKTAQRLLVELKDRLEKEFADISASATSDGTTAGAARNAQQDAISALESLGYKAADATKVVRSLPTDLSSEELIRQSLRQLSGRVL